MEKLRGIYIYQPLVVSEFDGSIEFTSNPEVLERWPELVVSMETGCPDFDAVGHPELADPDYNSEHWIVCDEDNLGLSVYDASPTELVEFREGSSAFFSWMALHLILRLHKVPRILKRVVHVKKLAVIPHIFNIDPRTILTDKDYLATFGTLLTSLSTREWFIDNIDRHWTEGKTFIEIHD